MFEEESERYAIKKHCMNCWLGNTDGGSRCRGLDFCNKHKDFQDGAEFGYNKANEWHYPSKGEYPEKSGRYLVYTGGEPFILDFDTEVNSFGYWVILFGDNWGVRDEDFETVKDRGEDEVIAWKEIVLPNVKESE